MLRTCFQLPNDAGPASRVIAFLVESKFGLHVASGPCLEIVSYGGEHPTFVRQYAESREGSHIEAIGNAACAIYRQTQACC